MADALGRVARVIVQQVKPVEEGGYNWFAAGYNSIVIEELHVNFQVTLDPGAAPNTCTIKVYNLAPQTRADLQQLPLTCLLEVGYEGDVGRLFSGDIKTARSVPEKGGQIITEIDVADGDRAWRGAWFNKSYRRGTQILQVLRDCARSAGLGLPRSIENDPELRAQPANGYSGEGGSLQQLEEIFATYGYSCSIVDGQLEVVRDGEVIASESYLVDAEHGLINVAINPKGEAYGATIKRTLDRLVKPKRLLTVRSKEFQGVLKSGKVVHSGDTKSGDWYTTIEGKQYKP